MIFLYLRVIHQMSKKSKQQKKSLKELDQIINAQNIVMQDRISNLLKQLNANMHEREQILAITLLGAISGQNTFLYGPPGTAKSLISRRLACAFETSNYFECLMNRFTTSGRNLWAYFYSRIKRESLYSPSRRLFTNGRFCFSR